MATATRRTYRGHDGMRPPKFHQNRSTDRPVIAFPIFCNLCSDLRKTLVERRRSTQTVAIAPVIQHTPANAEQLHLISIIKGRNATRFRLILLSYSY